MSHCENQKHARIPCQLQRTKNSSITTIVEKKITRNKWLIEGPKVRGPTGLKTYSHKYELLIPVYCHSMLHEGTEHLDFHLHWRHLFPKYICLPVPVHILLWTFLFWDESKLVFLMEWRSVWMRKSLIMPNVGIRESVHPPPTSHPGKLGGWEANQHKLQPHKRSSVTGQKNMG